MSDCDARTEMKTCSTCDQERPLSEYRLRHDRGEPMPRSRCKSCEKAWRDRNKERLNEQRRSSYERDREQILARNQRYVDENRDAVMQRRRELWATNREALNADQRDRYRQNRVETLARQAEYYDRNRDQIAVQRAAYRVTNKEAIASADKAYRLANLEKLRAWKRQHYAANPHLCWQGLYRRRALRFGFKPEVEDFTKADVIARYGDSCVYCETGAFEHLDHATPVSKGGPHTIDNVRPSCAACNLAKNDQTEAEWTSRARDCGGPK